MSNPASLSARLEVIEIVLEELLAGGLAALPSDRAAMLTGRLQARAGYISADPGYDPVERQAHELAVTMDRLLRAASQRSADMAAVRLAALNLRPLWSERQGRPAAGGIEPVSVFD
jgi:hypothetical protein